MIDAVADTDDETGADDDAETDEPDDEQTQYGGTEDDEPTTAVDEDAADGYPLGNSLVRRCQRSTDA